MPNPIDLARAVYRGYRGDRENHVLRILVTLVMSTLIALDAKGLSKDALSTMAVIVSVLAGFSFTALFSSHSHSMVDLPPPNSESDRQDLRILITLFGNFRDRARYFLVIAVICLLLVFLIGIPFDIGKEANELTLGYTDSYVYAIDLLWDAMSFIGRLSALILFFEILYSFYRLAQTVFAILDTRRSYLESRD